ncbi:GNAT family N-acetyltransferase [Niveispirillum sp.]|uniref:GNAT family N-acetyltransferase n=1 Tax=Niveispirillum sp. TaxID=1917217 RepID=UPI001B6D8052|nr:GNAT family N-acetyltransferase [Niveispirillum sp.]MBP7339365.1 GNAT family N-acetyltransferase [Niveispirillum sp.]
MLDGVVSPELTVEISGRISRIGAAEWDACLLDTPGGDDHPFLRHAYLSVLEECGAIDGQVWKASYLTARDLAGTLVAAIPVFLKSNPFGDFVEEGAWVDALHRTGGHYYPKLQICAPFAPVGGPRILLRRGAPPDIAARLIDLMTRTARKDGLSGIHATFVNEADLSRFTQAGWHVRTDTQFHWQNRDYRNFDDFLATLTCDKRGMIRRERRQVGQNGVDIHVLTGADLRPEHMDVFAGFYRSTFLKKQTLPHLPREFFLLLGERMADDLVLVMARQGGRWVGGTLNFRGRRTLFCRSWGGVDDLPFLYFEVTNYRAIDCAIDRGLCAVDGGMGGHYKLKRGYQPVPVWSAHHMTDPAMDDAVARFLINERAVVARDRLVLAGQGPYRAG